MRRFRSLCSVGPWLLRKAALVAFVGFGLGFLCLVRKEGRDTASDECGDGSHCQRDALEVVDVAECDNEAATDGSEKVEEGAEPVIDDHDITS